MKRSIFHVGIIAVALSVYEARGQAEKALASITNAVPMVKLSLDQLVAEALERNPEANFYKAEIAAAKGERSTAGAYQNPELNGDFGRRTVTGGGLREEGTAWSASLMQPFEYPGRMALRKAIANRQIELAQLGYAQFRAALESKVRTLGYSLYIAQEKAEAALQVAQRSQELAEVLVQRDPAGVTPLLESRIIEASSITARRKAAQAVTEAKVALYELNQLRGAPLESSLNINPSEIQFPEPSPLEELVHMAEMNNFEIRARQVELTQQGLRVDLSKKDRMPTVSGGPFYSQERAGETERTVGLGLSIPLPLWNRNKGNIATAKARQDQATTSLFTVQRAVERQLREHYASYQALVEQMAFWRPESLTQLREAAELGDRHYRLGALPVATYVELQDKYLEAMQAILETQKEALDSLQQISLITGKTFQNPTSKEKATQ